MNGRPVFATMLLPDPPARARDDNPDYVYHFRCLRYGKQPEQWTLCIKRRAPRIEPFVEIGEAINLCERLRSSARIRDVESSALNAVLDKVHELARALGHEQLARQRADQEVNRLGLCVVERDAEIAELKRTALCEHNHD